MAALTQQPPVVAQGSILASSVLQGWQPESGRAMRAIPSEYETNGASISVRRQEAYKHIPHLS